MNVSAPDARKIKNEPKEEMSQIIFITNQTYNRHGDRMPGLFSAQVADDRVSRERNVPEKIQQFVADELIGETEVIVHDA